MLHLQPDFRRSLLISRTVTLSPMTVLSSTAISRRTFLSIFATNSCVFDKVLLELLVGEVVFPLFALLRMQGRLFYPKFGVCGENQSYLAKFGNCIWSVLTCLPFANFSKGFFLLPGKDVVERSHPTCQAFSGGSRARYE